MNTFCPLCGAPVVSRERRPNGNSRCEKGCSFPTSQENPNKSPVKDPPQQRLPYTDLVCGRIKDQVSGWVVITSHSTSDSRFLIHDLGGRNPDMLRLSQGAVVDNPHTPPRFFTECPPDPLWCIAKRLLAQAAAPHFEGGVCTIPALAVIEDLELNLHPQWQQEGGFWLKRMFPKTLFVVATNSPLVCQAADLIVCLPSGSEKVRFLTEGDGIYGTASQILNRVFGLKDPYPARTELLRETLGELENKLLDNTASPEELSEYDALKIKLGMTSMSAEAEISMRALLQKLGI